MLHAMMLLLAVTVEPLWPSLEKMPDYQPQQYASPSQELKKPDFKCEDHRMPYLEWCEAPAAAQRNGVCVLFISGGGYKNQCDGPRMRPMAAEMTKRGCQCVFLWHRVPRPQGLAIYQSAWEDGQRAVRLVRAAAKARNFDPEKIAVVGCSAGSHLTVLLATSSLTPAYYPVDGLDKLPCNIAWGIPFCTAYALTDGLESANRQKGEGAKLSSVFKFDAQTSPMCLIHGGDDPYSPLGSTQIYRQLRRMKVPAEVHLDADRKHGLPSLDYAIGRMSEFLRQLGAFGKLGVERALDHRFYPDCTRLAEREELWPRGKMPDVCELQKYAPYLIWYHPTRLSTRAIQVILPGGGYSICNSNGEGTPLAHYFNLKGMTAVVVRYRTPRSPDKSKAFSAWEDAQRAIRMVRSEAKAKGLDPDRIGVSGFSAGGHLSLLCALNSETPAYAPVDDLDKVSTRVQWAVPFYPAYVLTDGLDKPNATGGNDDSAVIGDEFKFDAGTCPMCFLHGDSDGWAAMNSVKVWEKLRTMGIQSDLHTYVTRNHCFHMRSSEGTGSWTAFDRIWEFLTKKGLNK